MKFFQALVIVIGLLFLRRISKGLLGEFYYSNVGDAISDALTQGIIIFVVWRILKEKRIDFFPTKTVSKEVVIHASLVIFFLFLMIIIVGGFEDLYRRGSVEFFKQQFIFGWSDTMVKYFIGALIIGPIFEELLFNGILLRNFLREYSVTLSIILTVLIFTSFHFGQGEVDFLITDKIAIAALSSFSAWLVIKTSNIKLSICLHFFWNLLNYLFPLVISIIGLNLNNPTIFFVFSVISLMISVLMLIRNFKRLRSVILIR
jgi:membrane protease YdiL (CAAX protease family)